MRLLKERIPVVTKDLVDALVKQELIDIAAGARAEVDLDVESVLKEYRRADYELTERAKDLVAQRGLDFSKTFKLKQKLAAERGFGLNEDGVQWIADQIIEIFQRSPHVEEIFGDDNELRAAMAPVLKRELYAESGLDKEVKARIRNLQEGTADYEIEYRKTMEQIRSARKLDD